MPSIAKFDPTLLGIIITPIVGAVVGLINILILKKTRIDSVVVPLDTQQRRDLVRIAGIIKEGARSFLKKEYSFMSVFVIIMGGIVGLATQDGWTVLAFVLGAFLSASCGWVGMSVAVNANYKTTYSATLDNGLNESLKVAFASGAVMGFGVVCSGILGLVILYSSIQGLSLEETRYLAGFGFGASSIALFARVGGGIYTKAADVGADLVGKVEAGLPEDDPRNPATIADNVGDNVGDVAGMGADLFESFVGGIIASIQLSQPYAINHYRQNGTPAEKTVLYLLESTDSDTWKDYMREDVRCLIAFPFWISGVGILCSVIGLQLVRTSSTAAEKGLQERLLNTIRIGMGFTGFLSAACSLVIAVILFGSNKRLGFDLWGCNVIGLVSGVGIGYFTEYATSFTYKPTQTIAKKGKTGAATVVIQGIGIGMLSTMAPTLIIFIAILSCFELGSTYGIAIAAVGMLSTLGITLATDAFGPVADNAGGLAEMAKFPEEVRETTDGLDALGNTTAATGKGFAIGSAVLSSLALLSAFKDDAGITEIDVSKSEVLAGAIFGACLPFIFAAMTMMAVGRAATMMIVEVRRQIKELDLLGDNPKVPEYSKCVAISTQASVYEMIIPGVLAIVAPLFIGYLLGAEALGGLLVGGICSGFMLAVYMANAGGAWDNAKKWVEGGQMKVNGKVVKKGSAIHDATVTGDTIGDPFKDTSGPSLNILMKLMTMISLVFASKQFKNVGPYDPNKWYIAVIIAILFVILATSLTFWMRSQGFGKTPPGVAVEMPLKEIETLPLTLIGDESESTIL